MAARRDRNGLVVVAVATAAVAVVAFFIVGQTPSFAPSGFGTEYGQRLAVQRDNSIVLVDLATGDEVVLNLDQPTVRSGLASVGGNLAYLSRTNAIVVTTDGSTVREVGAADAVLDGATPSSVWVGKQIEVYRMRWREIDRNGDVLRSAVRSIPLDFGQPDLVWGHQDRMLRLTEDDVRPWETFAQGSPVAVGPNDLILTVCNVELDCERRWFEPRSGLDQGPLAADVADYVPTEPGGVLSPNAHYAAAEHDSGQGVVLVSLSTGQEVETECLEATDLRWSTGEELMACRTDLGIVVHELETATRLLIRSAGDGANGFTFVAS